MSKEKPGSKLAQLRAMRETSFEEGLRMRTDPEGYYADEVRASVRQTAESIIHTGRILLEAKEAIEHGRWTAWVEDRLPISARTVRRLIAIAEGIPKTADSSVLPPAVDTLYDLSKLDPTQWKAIEPRLSPELTKRDLRQMVGGEAIRSAAAEPAGPPPAEPAFPGQPIELRSDTETAEAETREDGAGAAQGGPAAEAPGHEPDVGPGSAEPPPRPIADAGDADAIAGPAPEESDPDGPDDEGAGEEPSPVRADLERARELIWHASGRVAETKTAKRLELITEWLDEILETDL